MKQTPQSVKESETSPPQGSKVWKGARRVRLHPAGGNFKTIASHSSRAAGWRRRGSSPAYLGSTRGGGYLGGMRVVGGGDGGGFWLSAAWSLQIKALSFGKRRYIEELCVWREDFEHTSVFVYVCFMEGGVEL